MPRPTLAIVGGTVVDAILPDTRTLPTWPAHTEFTARNLVLLERAPVITIGGNGANAAFVAARRGAKVTLHTTVGRTGLGFLARDWLRRAGVVVRSPATVASTALNVTAANRRHQRATFFYPGSPPSLPLAALLRSRPRAVLVCGWPHPPLAELARAFARLRRAGIVTALDPGPILGRPWSPAALRPVLAELDVLLTNEHELVTLTRARSGAAALAAIRRQGRGHVLVKRGADGVGWLAPDANTARDVPGRKVRAINTVGAGDTFNGAFLTAWLRGATPLAAIREANAVAARVVASGRGVLGAPARRKPGTAPR